MLTTMEPRQANESQENSRVVSDRLKHFQVIRNRGVRRAIRFYPLFIIAIILLDSMFFQQRLVIGELLRLTNYTALALSAVFFTRLFSVVPTTLDSLWNRGVLRNRNGGQPEAKEFVDAIDILENWLNSRVSWILGIAAFIFAVANLAVRLQGWNATWLELSIRLALVGITWFLGAFGFWCMMVIAYSVIYLSFRFDLVVFPAHPDQSGGLQPIGNLCLDNALVIIAPGISTAGWIVAVMSPALVVAYPQLAPFQVYWQNGTFQASLIAALLAGLMIFFLPLHRIHNEMVRQRIRHIQRLDDLGFRIDEISGQLLDSVQALEPNDVQKRLESLKWMREVYNESKRFPVWPFDIEIAIKLTVSQVVPLLSLTGIAKPLSDTVANLLVSLQPK